MGIADEINRLKLESTQLKWIVAQFMQRYGRDLVLFSMDNPVQFRILVETDAQKRQVSVRTQRVLDADPDEGQGSN